MVSGAGSEGLMSQELSGAPFVASPGVMVKAEPILPVYDDANDSVGASALTVKVTKASPEGPIPFSATMVNCVDAKATCGVPEITQVLLSTPRPAGSPGVP